MKNKFKISNEKEKMKLKIKANKAKNSWLCFYYFLLIDWTLSTIYGLETNGKLNRVKDLWQTGIWKFSS